MIGHACPRMRSCCYLCLACYLLYKHSATFNRAALGPELEGGQAGARMWALYLAAREKGGGMIGHTGRKMRCYRCLAPPTACMHPATSKQ